MKRSPAFSYQARLADFEKKEPSSMKRMAAAALAIVAFAQFGASGAQSQQGRGDWPCRQIKVANISPSSVWTGPPLETAANTWRDDQAIVDLVAKIGARRTSLEDSEKLIAEFAKTAGEKRAERLTALFAGVYERLESERHEVVEGLERYGRKQKDLAEKLRSDTQSLREEQDRKPSDAQRVKELSDALQWDTRIFDDRRQALGYVCETPALIEQRLGALARAILAAME